MRRIFWGALFSLLFIPLAAGAVATGFVPSSGLWFSPEQFSAGESVNIYAVVVNNEYALLDGTVAFFDRDSRVGTVEVKGLGRDTARQIKAIWKPSEGEHSISAKFIQAIATQEDGSKINLTADMMNSTIGIPLILNGTGPMQIDSTVDLAVVKEGDKLSLAAVAPTPLTIAGQASNALNVAKDTVTAGKEQAEDLFSKNRQALQNVGETVGKVTTTMGQIGSVYDKTKDALAKGKEYYATSIGWLGKVSPYWESVKPFWLKISNNNDLVRIGIIILVILVVGWFLRRRWRQRKMHRVYYD